MSTIIKKGNSSSSVGKNIPTSNKSTLKSHNPKNGSTWVQRTSNKLSKTKRVAASTSLCDKTGKSSTLASIPTREKISGSLPVIPKPTSVDHGAHLQPNEIHYMSAMEKKQHILHCLGASGDTLYAMSHHIEQLIDGMESPETLKWLAESHLHDDPHIKAARLVIACLGVINAGIDLGTTVERVGRISPAFAQLFANPSMDVQNDATPQMSSTSATFDDSMLLVTNLWTHSATSFDTDTMGTCPPGICGDEMDTLSFLIGCDTPDTDEYRFVSHLIDNGNTPLLSV